MNSGKLKFQSGKKAELSFQKQQKFYKCSFKETKFIVPISSDSMKGFDVFSKLNGMFDRITSKKYQIKWRQYFIDPEQQLSHFGFHFDELEIIQQKGQLKANQIRRKVEKSVQKQSPINDTDQRSQSMKEKKVEIDQFLSSSDQTQNNLSIQFEEEISFGLSKNRKKSKLQIKQEKKCLKNQKKKANLGVIMKQQNHVKTQKSQSKKIEWVKIQNDISHIYKKVLKSNNIKYSHEKEVTKRILGKINKKVSGAAKIFIDERITSQNLKDFKKYTKKNYPIKYKKLFTQDEPEQVKKESEQ